MRRDGDAADQQSGACAVTAPARPNTEILRRPVPSEIIAPVAITAVSWRREMSAKPETTVNFFDLG